MRKHWWGILFFTLIVLVGLLWIVIKLRTPDECREYQQDELAACKLVYHLDNDDVKWDGTLGGLMPIWVSSDIRKVTTTEKNVTPFLLAALKDKDRFVAVHVVLVEKFPGTLPYTALKVKLYGNGNVSYEGNDLEELHHHWLAQLSQQK